MKILVVTTDIDHIEPYQYIGLSKKGCNIHAICSKNAYNTELLTDSGIPVDFLNFNRRRSKTVISYIKNKVAEFQPDIVHVLRKKALSNVIPALKGSEAKLIAYRGIVGNLSFFDPVSWMTFLHPRIDKIICVAHAIKKHFINMRFGSYRLNKDKFITIHKGHLVERYETIKKYDLAELNIPEDSFVIGCVASMRPRKGVDFLVKAFNQLVQEQKNCYLLLVGSIRDNKIHKAIKDCPHPERIILSGNVSQEKAISIGGALDVIVMPSTKREGLPRSLIEAMAQGVPAVVTNIGGSPELIEQNVSGIIVPPRDSKSMTEAFKKLCDEPEKRHKMGNAAKVRIAEHFHVEKTIEKNYQLYCELLEKN
jgi:glycosyltransferase involved in cell wall biosynthesis